MPGKYDLLFVCAGAATSRQPGTAAWTWAATLPRGGTSGWNSLLTRTSALAIEMTILPDRSFSFSCAVLAAESHGVAITTMSHSAAAYRGKKALVVQAFALSFVVHFSTAAMYYFTALAIGAVGADFWQVTFASSIQNFLTVISPFTIAGEGIREAAQYMLLRNQIGAAAAIVSAALGFWAAEALTLVGGFIFQGPAPTLTSVNPAAGPIAGGLCKQFHAVE